MEVRDAQKARNPVSEEKPGFFVSESDDRRAYEPWAVVVAIVPRAVKITGSSLPGIVR
jgi:hypothetical protein